MFNFFNQIDLNKNSKHQIAQVVQRSEQACKDATVKTNYRPQTQGTMWGSESSVFT